MLPDYSLLHIIFRFLIQRVSKKIENFENSTHHVVKIRFPRDLSPAEDMKV